MVKLTLISLYNYDPALFSRLSLPAPLNTATAVNEILLEKGEFGSLYTDPDFAKFAIGAWSDANQMAFEHLAKVQAASYDPISNYDRTETETIDTTGSSTEEGKVSAYNSSQYQPSDSNTVEEKTGSERKLRAYGNIGTTTNAQMMLAEKEVVEGVNPYMIIANMFADAFCVKIF